MISPWIPVSERLPEDQEYVLVAAKHKADGDYSHLLAWYDLWNKEWCAQGSGYLEYDVATHWMPLPDFPAE